MTTSPIQITDVCPTWDWCSNTPHDESVWHRHIVAEIPIDDGKITVDIQQQPGLDRHPKVAVTTHYHGDVVGRHYNSIHVVCLSAFDAAFLASTIAAERSGRGYGSVGGAVSGVGGPLAEALAASAQMLGLGCVFPSLRRSTMSEEPTR